MNRMLHVWLCDFALGFELLFVVTMACLLVVMVSEGRSHGIHRSRVFVGVTTALSVLCFVVVVARFAVLAR